MIKSALITGVTGQDGSYLSEFLLEKGYEVWGFVRRTSNPNTQRLNNVLNNPYFHVVKGDLTDSESILNAITKSEPREVYNLAAMSYVADSWDQKAYVYTVNTVGAINVLEACRRYETLTGKEVRFYQAGSSEQFGEPIETPQNESTLMGPVSPYGNAKHAAYKQVKNNRDSHNQFCLSGILFNHESPRRGIEFVTRKITDAVARISTGQDLILRLGDIDSQRDWGFAGDYVEAMWLMLQQEEPKDYVIGTGEQHSVREFVELSFKHAGINIHWEGEREDEKGYDDNGKQIMGIDPRFYRPVDLKTLKADASKAKKELGWEPKTKFNELIKMMVESDIKKNANV